MVYIASVGIGLPSNELSQQDAKKLVYNMFQIKEIPKLERILSVFDHANIDSRQIAARKEWYISERTFGEKNNKYIEQSVTLSLNAIDQCLHDKSLLNCKVNYEDIDLIVFITSTGIATPSIDTYFINERPFKQELIRLPLWGLGCAGGAIGLARAADWLKGHPSSIALVVCCELCSLTFQKSDRSISNIVGTALFGDGVGAALLIGKESKYASHLKGRKLSIRSSSSFLKKGTKHLMGWDVNEEGFKVIFSKKIPKMIDQLWKKHLQQNLHSENIRIEEIDAVLAHPGGRKILEEIEKIIGGNKELLKYSYETLRQHGNMSSATVIYVLKKYLEDEAKVNRDKFLILCALGPGFSSEILLLEWL